MATNASGFFTAPTVPTPTRKIQPSIRIFGSGFRSPEGISKRVFSSSIFEGAEKHVGASASESRAPKLVSKGCKLIGCGSAIPSLKISNDDLAKVVDTNDEWIAVHTGIHNRCVLSGKESLTMLAVEAAHKALEMAQVDVDDVDLILMCTSTPDDVFGCAPQVQKALGCRRNPLAYDITAACSGFILVLVIGADAISRIVDWTDRGTCILFGDAAGAVLVQACDSEDDALLSFDVHSDGEGNRFMMNWVLLAFRFAVRTVPQSLESSLAKAGLPQSSIDWLLLHHANQRILDAVSTRMQIPSEQVISSFANYGNTSAASIPLALDEDVRSGKVKPGHTIAAAGFAAGLTWASTIFRWG
ncbi:3-oxoacyl-[acyl-carrier-protein] synthase III [Pyrus ussuriensis x Pyrus communis]|uniref:3-oxoacyl-[acyl-carrier-protein] synthase III n=1 Tax=Pyrus ussuriensis x Pyrus communis TaxID=2448454 RepID=A0A5N5H8L9_9ROSA|nr:3-oxoacyl-[acyl-carrier-protein] synthase III [Pyrus ussuriensis x Pyrus communis]